MRPAPADKMLAVFPVDTLGVGAVCPQTGLAAVEAAGGVVDIKFVVADGTAVELESP